jgi:thiamine kinase-like enzyme
MISLFVFMAFVGTKELLQKVIMALIEIDSRCVFVPKSKSALPDRRNMSEANEIVKNLLCWSGPVTPVRLDGGISNDNYLVHDAGRKFVVRVNGDAPIHGVLRINDVNCNKAAAAAGVAPDVFYATANAVVIDYINGKTFDASDVRNQKNIERLLPLLKATHIDAFHKIRGPVCAFWPFRVCRDYAFYLEENNSRMIGELSRFREINEQLEKIVGQITPVLGHNDLLAANIIDDGDRLWLIDWEHAGFSSSLFDLANLSTNNRLTDDQEIWLLENYFEKPVDSDLEHRFHAMKCASLLREAMWSMVSEISSTLDFDYIAYSSEYLNRFGQEYSQL